MRRYWVEEQFKNDDEFVLTGDVHHHIIKVCRQERGSQFELLLDQQKAYLVEITSVDKKNAICKIISEREIEPLKKPYVNLAVSLPRFQKMDEIVEDAVEMGIFKIWPFTSEFSFVRDLNKISESKQKRWDKIIVSATQQTGRGDLMRLSEACNLSKTLELFNQSGKNKGLFLYEGQGELSLKEALLGLDKDNIDNIWLFIGSEGGFSEREVDIFKENGLLPITTGSQILRVQTACVAMAGILKYQLDL